jgi:hypothetical protein
MHRLGAVPRMIYRGRMTTNPIQRKSTRDDGAASINSLNGDAPTLTEKMGEYIKGVKGKAAKLVELANEIASGRFVGTNLAKSFREQAEGLSAALDVLWGHVTEMFMGSMTGSLDPSGSSISNGPEFGLSQILDVEKKIRERDEFSELAIFALARTREEAMKALSCQANIEPEKALFLLQDDGT